MVVPKVVFKALSCWYKVDRPIEIKVYKADIETDMGGSDDESAPSRMDSKDEKRK